MGRKYSRAHKKNSSLKYERNQKELSAKHLPLWKKSTSVNKFLAVQNCRNKIWFEFRLKRGENDNKKYAKNFSLEIFTVQKQQE